MKQYLVYVQAPDGKPLMPTKRFGKVRKLLKAKKAIVVISNPFTIRLLVEPSGRNVQPVTAGIDPGRTNIGIACVTDNGDCLFNGTLETRNKEIKGLMSKRKQHRQASRRGERLARKRLAKKHKTTTSFPEGRILPGCEKPINVKDIINTEARFNNRGREKGWLTPSARQLLQTYMSLLRLVGKLLPIQSVSLEVNRFAFMDLEAGHRLWGSEYQHGPLFGYKNQEEAITDIQHGKCLLCGVIGWSPDCWGCVSRCLPPVPSVRRRKCCFPMVPPGSWCVSTSADSADMIPGETGVFPPIARRKDACFVL